MKKRFGAIFLSLCIAMGMLPTIAFAEEVLTWSTVVAEAGGDDYSLDGDGNLTIYTAEGLAWFADSVNDGNAYSGKIVTLSKNIDLEDANVTEDWIPIGSYTTSSYNKPFSGTFEGNGRSISGLSISNGDVYEGLFGFVEGATIQDLTVEGTVTATSGEAAYIGGFAGYAEAVEIIDCTNKVDVTGEKKVAGFVGKVNEHRTDKPTTAATFTRCTNEGDIVVTGGVEIAAGIAGYAKYATFIDCINNGDISNDIKFTAGILGYANDCIITGCSNTGTITCTYRTQDNNYVGGILGGETANATTIMNCYNEGKIIGGAYGYIGGIVGYTNHDVLNCYNIGEVTGSAYMAGGILGYSDGSIANCYNAGSISASTTFLGGVMGYQHTKDYDAIYFLESTASKGIGEPDDEITSFTEYGTIEGDDNALLDILNDWVDTKEEADGYQKWEQGNAYPVFEGSLPVSDTSTKYHYISVEITGEGETDPALASGEMYQVERNTDVTFAFIPEDGYEVTDVLVNGESVGECDEYTFTDVIIQLQSLEVIFENSDGVDEEEEEEEVVEEEIVEEEIVEESELPFIDVDEGDGDYDGIAYVYENGIMAGMTSEMFGGEYSITRGMIAAILHRMDGSEPVDAEHIFGDIADDMYYVEAVKWGKEVGVMAGVSETEFAPDMAITNEQLVAFLYRYANFLGMDMTISAGTDFSDYADASEITDYAYFAMLWAVDKGIIGGDSLNPTDEALRGDVATSLMKFMEMM